jgi:hypothetical protein
VILALCGCESRKDLDGRRHPLVPTVNTAEPVVKEAPGRQSAFAFFANRASAAVHRRGSLVMQCGSPDFAKYAQGGFRTSWIMGARDGDVRTALVDGHGASVYFPFDRDAGGIALDGTSVRIVFRARAAAAKQLVSIFLNEKRLSDVALPTLEWKDYSVTAPAEHLVVGENRLRFYFRNVGLIGERKTAAAFEEIRIGGVGVWTDIAAESTHGGRRLDSLLTGAGDRMSFYLKVPPGKPSLTFHLAGQADAAIRVAGGSVRARDVWSGRGKDEWVQSQVALANWEAQVIRLDFAAQCIGGRPWSLSWPTTSLRSMKWSAVRSIT